MSLAWLCCNKRTMVCFGALLFKSIIVFHHATFLLYSALKDNLTSLSLNTTCVLLYSLLYAFLELRSFFFEVVKNLCPRTRKLL